MKIGYFTDTYPPQTVNGVSISVGYFVDLLRKAGNTVYVIAPKVSGYKKRDKDVYRIPSNTLPSIPDTARIPIFLPDKAWIQVFTLDYDIIHGHGNGFFSLLALIIAKTKRIPFILTCHTLMEDYTHYFFNGKIVGPKTIDTLFRMCCNACDELIAPSEKMKDYLLKIGVTKPIIIIPNYLDIQKFTVKNTQFLHKNYALPPTAKIILSVGRLGKEKNFAFLIRVIQKVLLQDTTCHLFIVGEGFERKNLQKLIDTLGVSQNVHLIGTIDNAKMPNVYADADIFASGSTTEVHPMVVMEAAAAGLPLVLADDSAYDRELVSGKNGFSLPLDETLFAEKILLLLQDTQLRIQFGKSSRTIIEGHMNEKALVKQLLDVYQSVKLAHK